MVTLGNAGRPVGDLAADVLERREQLVSKPVTPQLAVIVVTTTTLDGRSVEDDVPERVNDRVALPGRGHAAPIHDDVGRSMGSERRTIDAHDVVYTPG